MGRNIRQDSVGRTPNLLGKTHSNWIPRNCVMGDVLQIGEHSWAASEVLSLLAQYQLLPRLQQEVLIDRALAEVECTDAEASEAYRQFCDRNQLTTDEHKQAWLSHFAMTPAQLEAVALRDFKLQKYKQQTWENQIPSDFLEHKRRFDRVVYSLIRTQTPGLAQELFFRIQDDGQAFAQLAQTYSEGPEAESGGLIGPVTLEVPHPQLAQLLSQSQPGQLHPPKQMGEWFVIVRLEKFLPAQLDDTIRQKLLDLRFQNWVREAVQQNPLQIL